MLKVVESGTEFNFKVKAYNYDDKFSIYEKNKFCGNSAVDFLALDKRSIYFIEVKNAHYFNTTIIELSEKICKIYKNFIDSISLISLSDDLEMKPFNRRLKNTTPKIILIITDKLPVDILVVYYEKIKKQLSKKLKKINAQIVFMLETESHYNNKLYDIARSS
jgi:hypothetical protein